MPLLELIRLLETSLGCTAVLDWQPDQPGDVPMTYADLRKSEALLGYRPQVDIATGLQRFATWFRAITRPKASCPWPLPRERPGTEALRCLASPAQ